MATTRHIPVKFNPLDITIYKERVSTMKYLTQGNLDYARELALMSLEAAEGYIAQIECDKNTIAELKAAMKTFNDGPADEQVKKYKEIAAHGMQAAELAQARVQELEQELAQCRAATAEHKPTVEVRELQHRLNMVNEDRSILEKKLGAALKEITELEQKYDNLVLINQANVAACKAGQADLDDLQRKWNLRYDNMQRSYDDLKQKYDNLVLINQANAASDPCSDCELDELRKELILAKKVIAGLNNSNLALMSAMEGLVK